MLAHTPWRRAMTPRIALQTLGITAGAAVSHAGVKKAYIAQTLQCHPDLHPDDPHATEKFRRLSEALRIALKSIEMRIASSSSSSRSGKGTGGGSGVSLDDAQSVLEALRQAIATYHRYRDATGSNKGDETTVESSDLFLSHSLEYVSSVCQRESTAMRRVEQFCNELPEVLCGKSCVLFEAVAFFNARYVEAMSRCVLRFSKNLPVIVNRVVKGRKKYVRYVHNKANSGVGTGNRPRQQRIEEMAMKPLVLVGALLFDQESDFKSKTNSSKSYSNNNNNSNDNEEESCHLHNTDRSTCGAISRKEIKICEELICTIYPSDSIGDITEKIGKWEAASYERLQLELAMVDTTSLISGMLDLNEHCLAVMHHLHLPKETSEKVSLTLQKLVCSLCYSCDEKTQGNEGKFKDDESIEEIEVVEKEEEEEEKEDISYGIARCRYLAKVTAPYIEGNITLMWDKETPLVENTEEIAVGDENEILYKCKKNIDKEKDYIVIRHMSCCTAEMIRFAVSVKLSKDFGEFLGCLVAALETVLEQAHTAASILSKLLELRELVVNEEFIPSNKNINNNKEYENEKDMHINIKESNSIGLTKKLPISFQCGVYTKNESCNKEVKNEDVREEEEEEEEEEEKEYKYRGPIHCFPRIFSMDTTREFIYWQKLYENRVYLAQHAPAMNAINLYYNCLPYKPHLHATHHGDKEKNNEEVFGGWVGEAEDGTDNVVITQRELENNSAFREWLEEIVEQSSLNKECHRIVSEAGVGYVTRDPALPLPHYLSFIKVFCMATAVRGVLERNAGKTRTATTEDTGFIIVVGTECDVRDGGRLIVPWWMDPSVFLALLQENSGSPVLLD